MNLFSYKYFHVFRYTRFVKPPEPVSGNWTFLTNHARVLLSVALAPNLRVRDIADEVQITERAAQGILNDLEHAGYLDKVKVGRRNEYTIHTDVAFRHPHESGHDVGELLSIFIPEAAGSSSRRVRRPKLA